MGYVPPRRPMVTGPRASAHHKRETDAETIARDLPADQAQKFLDEDREIQRRRIPHPPYPAPE